MEYKVNINYLNESNEIVCDTQDMQLIFKLSDYYKGAQINQLELLSDGIIRFYVKKSDNFLEDFISIKDSIYGEDDNKTFDLEYQGDHIFGIKGNRCIIQICNQKFLDIGSLEEYIKGLLGKSLSLKN